MLTCKEYHKNYKKNMLDTIENEFDGYTRELFKIILYGLYAQSEFYAKQIHDSVDGLGTADNKLIRSIIARADVDMKKIKKYYKKIYSKDMSEQVNSDLSCSYKKIIEGLMNK